jgi:tRNA G26 N,N-dimethylase Trm1
MPIESAIQNTLGILRVSSGETCSSWSSWAAQAGEPTGSKKNFVQNLEARGYRPHRTHTARGFYGLRI